MPRRRRDGIGRAPVRLFPGQPAGPSAGAEALIVAGGPPRLGIPAQALHLPASVRAVRPPDRVYGHSRAMSKSSFVWRISSALGRSSGLCPSRREEQACAPLRSAGRGASRRNRRELGPYRADSRTTALASRLRHRSNQPTMRPNTAKRCNSCGATSRGYMPPPSCERRGPRSRAAGTVRANGGSRPNRQGAGQLE
jgi:hypothetical protein